MLRGVASLVFVLLALITGCSFEQAEQPVVEPPVGQEAQPGDSADADIEHELDFYGPLAESQLGSEALSWLESEGFVYSSESLIVGDAPVEVWTGEHERLGAIRAIFEEDSVSFSARFDPQMDGEVVCEGNQGTPAEVYEALEPAHMRIPDNPGPFEEGVATCQLTGVY